MSGSEAAADRGHVAVITGGTKGIGLACAQLLAGQGMQVFIGARSADDVQDTAAKLTAEGGGVVRGATVDVTSTDAVREFVSRAVHEFGPVDVLVNNAGISGGGVTADLTEQTWDSVLDTNLNGVFRMTHAALNEGGMRHLSWGRIINIASTAGKQGVVLGAPYSASKHGVVGFTKALGNELAPTGITVNAVCPGYVETPMAQTVRGNYARAWGISEDEVLRKFEAKIPLGRYTTPDEVAGLVGYLTSTTADAITAQALNVCGGLGNF
ncbi:SDR family NAD(P)-dependent oxidoreductase [Luteipulveratus mongoliensis]|uniref:Ketoacyl reductase n=1 Tax=Luteipulveratus mongoliensis TaxID=571913 RepID=A0A0K1JFL7_9MICO|nr:SDR family NAD(P)-dependent oxidoreductase [Luteipulveratus mongoliensis]AKU15496.1 ketoacyl reductase [Luteipulveratus mongoliensis]